MLRAFGVHVTTARQSHRRCGSILSAPFTAARGRKTSFQTSVLRGVHRGADPANTTVDSVIPLADGDVGRVRVGRLGYS